MKKLLTFLILLNYTIVAYSQSLELSPVLITDSYQQKRIRETGRNIILLNKQEIQKIPGNSLDEILRFVPGIEVQMRGPAGAQADFVLRGSTFQQVLVLIDGIRMNEPLTGHFNSYIPVLKEEIQRIEIIKGAAASIYGPDAVGGVIHIITQKAVEDEKINQIQGEYKRGLFGLSQKSISAQINRSRTSFFIGAQDTDVDGQPLRGTSGFVNTRLYTASLRTSLKNQWNLHLRGAIDRRNFNAQNFYTTFVSDTAREKVNSTWQQASLSKSTDKAEYSFLIGARQLTDEYQFRPGASANNNRTQLLNTDIRQIRKWNWQQMKWTTGVQWFNKVIRSNDRGNHTHQHLGFYSNWIHQPLKGLFLTEGIRLDWDQSYQWSLVPQLNVAYILNNTTIRGSIGKGIRDADFTERYNNYNKTLVTSGRIGNPNLNAEKSMNMEMGIDLFTEKSVQIHSTVFRRNQADMIDWVLTKFENMPRQSNLIATGSYALASNVASVNTTGIEVDINGSHRLGPKLNLRWNSGLTWVNAVAANDISSIYLSNYANVVWNSNFQLSHERGMISISTLFKNRAEQKTNSLAVGVTKSFGLVNARADFYLWKRRGTLYMQAENLFNVAYADFLGARMPGRWLMLGVRVEVENKKRN